MTDPFVTIRSPGEGISAVINPLGAELWSLTDADGHELMTNGDPAWWTGHAPLLFPVVGTLTGDSYRLPDGRRFTLPRHGFARRKSFRLAEQGGSHVVFALAPDAETHAAYPFAFRLTVAYSVEGETLAMRVTVGNDGDEPMPYNLGFHPAFAWPLPYGAPKDAHRLLFEAPEPQPIRRLGANGLVLPDPQPTPVAGRTLTPTVEMFEGDALIWDRLESRSILFGAQGSRALQIDFPDCPHLGLWQKPGAPFLCIEPWAGYADPDGFDDSIWDKPGILTLGPGEERAYRLTVSLVGG